MSSGIAEDGIFFTGNSSQSQFLNHELQNERLTPLYRELGTCLNIPGQALFCRGPLALAGHRGVAVFGATKTAAPGARRAKRRRHLMTHLLSTEYRRTGTVPVLSKK